MTDHDPEAIPPTDPNARQLKDLKAGNMRAIADLAANGVDPRAVTPVLTAIRLDALLDAILSPEDRLTYELMAEARMGEALTQLKNQVARSRLTAGIVPVKSNGKPH